MFQYSDEIQADFHKTVKFLIRDNGGRYKSAKQAKFLYTQFNQLRDPDDVNCVKNLFGIDILEGQRILFINGYTRWADYGSNSFRPVSWIYVYDKGGIVSEYKLGYVGTMRSGTHPDPTKTKALWTRVGDAPSMIEEDAPKEEVVSNSNFYGILGRRVEFTGVIKSCIEFQRNTRFSYYDSGIGYVTKILVGEDVIVYWGQLAAEVGETVQIRATIKDHDIRDGVKQTIINRPKLISKNDQNS